MKIRNLYIIACAIAAMFMAGTVQAQSGTWGFDRGGNWSVATNWTGDVIADGADNTATLGNFITADRTITLDTARTIGNITASDASNNYTISGANTLTLDKTTGTPTISVPSGRTLTITSPIDGNDGLTKSNTGTLILNAANTFTGGITISAGILQVDNGVNAASFGNSANVVTFTGNATLHNNNGAFTMAQGIAVNSGVTATLSGAYGETLTVNGAVTGDGTILISGASNGWAVNLNNTANSFTGKINVYGGSGTATLTMKSLGDSENAIGLGRLNAGDAGVFNYTGSAALIRAIHLHGSTATGIFNNSGSGVVTINYALGIIGTGNKTLTLGGSNSGNNTFAGAITNGTGSTISLAKSDGGKWILSGTNTYTGGTTVNAGTLTANAANALGRGNVTVIAGTLVIGAADATTSSASLYLPSAATKNITMNADANVARLFINSVEYPSGSYTSSGAGTNWMNTGTGALIVGTVAAQPLYWDLNGSTSGSGSATPTGIWDAANWNDLYNGSGFVSTWTAGRTAAFAAGTDATGAYAVTVGSEKDIGGLTFEEGEVTLSGSVALRLVSDAVAFVASGSTGIVATVISEDAPSRSLTKVSTGRLILSGNNTYSGATTLAAGSLTLANADAISSSSILTVQGGDVTVSANVGIKELFFNTVATPRTVSGSGSLAFAPGGIIRNSDGNIDCIISVPITGSPSVRTKDSANNYYGLKFAPTAGTVTLGAVLNPDNTGSNDKSGINLGGTTTGNTVSVISYAGTDQYGTVYVTGGEWTVGAITNGTLTISGGTLILGPYVCTLMYNVMTMSGGKLSGTPTMYSPDKRGAFYVNSGATVAPGTNGVGTITFDWGTGGTPLAGSDDYSLWFKSGSTFEWEIGATGQDKIHLTEGRLYADTGMILKVRDAGGKPKAADQLSVFTYAAGVTRNLGTVTIDISALPGGWTGTPSLVDNGTGTIYLTGLQAPISGTLIQLK